MLIIIILPIPILALMRMMPALEILTCRKKAA
jgi:hypothetical protein